MFALSLGMLSVKWRPEGAPKALTTPKMPPDSLHIARFFRTKRCIVSGPLHSPCVKWCRTRVATLLLLSINGIYTVGKPPAAQAIKPAHLIDPIHAPTRVLAYLARDTQSIDWRANL